MSEKYRAAIGGGQFMKRLLGIVVMVILVVFWVGSQKRPAVPTVSSEIVAH